MSFGNNLLAVTKRTKPRRSPSLNNNKKAVHSQSLRYLLLIPIPFLFPIFTVYRKPYTLLIAFPLSLYATNE